MAAMKENPSLKFGDIRKLSLNSCVYLMMHQKFGTLVQFDFSNTDELLSSIHLSKAVDGVTIHAITPPKVQIKNCDGLSLFDMTRKDYLKFWKQTCDDDDIQLLLKLFTEIENQKIDEYNFQDVGDVKKARKVLAEEATKLIFPLQPSKRATNRSQSPINNSATNQLQSPDNTSATKQSQSPDNTTTTSTTGKNNKKETPPRRVKKARNVLMETKQSQSPGNTTTTSTKGKNNKRETASRRVKNTKNVLTESPLPPSYIVPKKKRDIKKPNKLNI